MTTATKTPRKKARKKKAPVKRQKLPNKNKLPRPSTEPVLPDVSAGFSAIVQVAHNVLQNPDVALRTDRRMADQMQRDPMITAPLFRRMLATAQLKWQIVAPDDTDPFQIDVAETVDRIIRDIPRLVDVFRDLLWATFRGTGVSEMYWAQNRADEWIIEGHRPHHGDKITYDIHGNPRILVRQQQIGGRELTQAEIERLIIHTHDPEDGSFFEPAEAGYVFKGRGLRDLIWPYWWLKHNALLFWVQFLERFGGGFAFGKYPMGNKKAKDAIETVLKNLINDSKVSVPVPPGESVQAKYGIEMQTVGGNKQTVDAFLLFIDGWAGKHIRILIEGTTQTTQEGGDGLGSGRAAALMSIFEQYRDYDSAILEQTLTEQLATRVQRFNFGDLPFQCRFEFIKEDQDFDADRSRIETAVTTGIPVPQDWLYETLGIPIPQDDDQIVDLGAVPAAMPGGVPGPFGFSALASHLPANQAQARRRMFGRALAGMKG